MFTKPTLILNESICRLNIERMVSKANSLGLQLRPHFKTHQSKEVGSWFRDYGINRIAVSSVPMAEYFAEGGWDNITIAFPLVKSQAENIDNIARKINLQVTVSSIGNAKQLANSITSKVEVYIEIDTGQGRSGLQANDFTSINEILQAFTVNNNINFIGFLSHAGHSYQSNKDSIEDLNAQATQALNQLKKEYFKKYPNLTISYGDTPTSCLCNCFEGVDELRPGNFAFFDMQQAVQGVCLPGDIAIALACPVVAVYPNRLQSIIWGGAVHLSKDFYTDNFGQKSFGAICKLNNDYSWSDPIEGLCLESISQEHGVIKAKSLKAIEGLSEGDWIAILPAHSCLTADKMGEYWVKERGFISMMS